MFQTDLHGYAFQELGRHGFYDLSFRASFNDEPGAEDIPNKNVSVSKVVEIDGREVYRERLP